MHMYMAHTVPILPLKKGNSLGSALVNKRISLTTALHFCTYRLYSVVILGEYFMTS